MQSSGSDGVHAIARTVSWTFRRVEVDDPHGGQLPVLEVEIDAEGVGVGRRQQAGGPAGDQHVLARPGDDERRRSDLQQRGVRLRPAAARRVEHRARRAGQGEDAAVAGRGGRPGDERIAQGQRLRGRRRADRSAAHRAERDRPAREARAVGGEGDGLRGRAAVLADAVAQRERLTLQRGIAALALGVVGARVRGETAIDGRADLARAELRVRRRGRGHRAVPAVAAGEREAQRVIAQRLQVAPAAVDDKLWRGGRRGRARRGSGSGVAVGSVVSGASVTFRRSVRSTGAVAPGGVTRRSIQTPSEVAVSGSAGGAATSTFATALRRSSSKLVRTQRGAVGSRRSRTTRSPAVASIHARAGPAAASATG